MGSKIDWKALGAVYAGPPSKPRQLTKQDMASRLIGGEVERELAEERAAIMEYDGGLSRTEAEAYAFQIIGNHN